MKLTVGHGPKPTLTNGLEAAVQFSDPDFRCICSVLDRPKVGSADKTAVEQFESNGRF